MSILHLDSENHLAAASPGSSGETAPQGARTHNAEALPQIVTTVLRPHPKVWLRKLLVCGLSGYLLISPLSSSVKLDCVLIALAAFGTYRITRVSAAEILWQYHFGFIPLYTRKVPVREGALILTNWEERSGLGEALLLGLWGLVLAPLADWLSPLSGGPYHLWLRNSDGQRFLVWRGRVQKTFYRNHQILTTTTGLASQRITNDG